MGKTLTALAVEKMQAGPTRREVPDGLVTGLYIIMSPTGAKSWAVRYRAAGMPRKLTLGSFPAIDLKSARELAQRALVEVAKGGDPASAKKAAKIVVKAPPADRDLIEKVVDQFVERYARANTKEGTARETERLLKKEVLSLWKGRRLSTITRADVHELLDGLVDRGTPILANRTLAALRKCCSWAVERGIVESSPVEKVKAPSAERSRDRVLSDHELRLVWTACESLGWPFGPLFRLLILSCQRRDEVASLRWSELDLDAKLWTLPRERAKNGVEHVVPLSDAAMTILRALPRVGPFVFSTNGKTAVSGFSRAKERLDTLVTEARGEAGALPGWTIHDVRRTGATGLARLGVALPTIEKILNHTSGSFRGVVGVYQRHSFQDEKARALEAWGAAVERLAADQPAANVVQLRA